MSKPLSGRVALVTGASSGIGDATARALAAAGADVVVTARRADRLDALVRDLEKQGVKAHAIEADLLKDSDNKRIVTETEETFGRLDILVNNAGVMLLSPVADANPDDWRRMLELNVLAMMISSQAALPGMRKRGSGDIINISSTAGRVASPSGAGYSATKFAVVALSESLRKEVQKDKVRVCVIEPGLVATELRDHIPDPATKKALNQWAESLRQLQPEDVANAVVYVASQPPQVNVNEILMRPTDQER
jgi:NADP-dependent 3-hydroxy acid dehydrogenase YdfG